MTKSAGTQEHEPYPGLWNQYENRVPSKTPSVMSLYHPAKQKRKDFSTWNWVQQINENCNFLAGPTFLVDVDPRVSKERHSSISVILLVPLSFSSSSIRDFSYHRRRKTMDGIKEAAVKEQNTCWISPVPRTYVPNYISNTNNYSSVAWLFMRSMYTL
jgi:hypothetical protein